jgi:hypothetical protein
MEIKIKDAQYNVVGYIDDTNSSSPKIKDAQYNVIGYIDDANSSSSKIKDNQYNVIGYTEGGGTNAQKGAAFFVLPRAPLKKSSDEKPTGCLGWALAFFGVIFLKLPIVGKICALMGIALPIIGAIIDGNGNYILIVPFGFLIGGGIGALGNLVIPLLSKAGKLGTLIGAIVIGVFLGILGGMNSAKNILPFTIMGLIMGVIVGAVIGSIVGLIKKQIDKKNKSSGTSSGNK